MLAMPGLAMSAAVICAVSCVAETKVVVRLLPFQRTVEPATKLVPVTVSVKAVPLAGVDEGESDVSVGTGLVTVNVSAFDVPPPGAGVVAVRLRVPAVARSVCRELNGERSGGDEGRRALRAVHGDVCRRSAGDEACSADGDGERA